MSLEIKGFIESSFLDWDGKIVSTLFLPYCNFRCPFCHNSGLIEDPQGYENIPQERIEKYLSEHSDYIDGICLTGGEPALHHKNELFKFMKKIKQNGFLIKFDTNGTEPGVLNKAFKEKLIDYVAMDIKGPLDERYNRLSGIKTDLNKIKKSIKLVMNSGVDYEFRTTVVPTLLNRQDVADIAKYLAGAKRFVLQQFVPENTWDDSLRTLRPLDKEELQQMVKLAKKYIPATIVRGV